MQNANRMYRIRRRRQHWRLDCTQLPQPECCLQVPTRYDAAPGHLVFEYTPAYDSIFFAYYPHYVRTIEHCHLLSMGMSC